MSGETNGQVGTTSEGAEAVSAAGGVGEAAIVSPAGAKFDDGYADTDRPPQPVSPSSSKRRTAVGRVVHVYSDRWDGPRPGLVVFAGEGEQPCHTVNVALDGTRPQDRQVLAECRQAVTGNSFAGLFLFDPLTPEQRAAAIEATAPFGNPQTRMIAEWPPVV